MSVRSNSVSRRGSECYETGAGLVPDMNLAYDMEPPDPHRDLLCMRVSNVMNIGTSYHEYVVHVESGFLSVYENVGDRLRHEAGTLKDRVYLRDAVVERVTDVQHGVKVNTLVLAIKPMDSTHSAHWRKFKFRSSEDPKRTDGSITLEWEIIIRKHILFYHENGIIITPDPGLVFELSREENCVDSAAMKMKTIFVNVCSDDLMPKIIKRGVIKEKRMRIIRGPERVLRGRTGVYNVIDVVIEPEALELCLEDVDVKEKVRCCVTLRSVLYALHLSIVLSAMS